MDTGRIKAYHGTGIEFDSFSDNIIFATDNIEYATAYTVKGHTPQIKTLNIEFKNPIRLSEYNDFKLTVTLQELIDTLAFDGYKEIATSIYKEYNEAYPEGDEFEAWEILSTDNFREIAIKHGYDGIIGIEGGNNIYAIYNKSQLYR